MLLIRAGAALLFAFAACHPRATPPDYGPEGPLADATALHAKVRAHGDRLRSLRGEAKAKLHTKDGSPSLTLLLALAQSDQLQREQLPYFGLPHESIARNGQGRTYPHLEINCYYSGPVSRATLGRFLTESIAPADA